MSNDVITVRVLVKGNVQGVFFRATVKDIADSNNISGWVRNLDDGSVEAMLQGTKKNVEKLVEWCHTGPPRARVQEVLVSVLTTEETYRNFLVSR